MKYFSLIIILPSTLYGSESWGYVQKIKKAVGKFLAANFTEY